MLEANNFKALRLGIASPEDIDLGLYGEVLNLRLLISKTLKPERDGTILLNSFGPTRDYECSCGK